MTRAALVASALLASALTLWAPQVALAPGPVSAGHRAVGCLACHVPLRGVPDARCTGCHRPGTIGTADGGASEVVRRLHQSAVRCAGCHPAHGGPAAGFRHEALPATALEACEGCHVRPSTAVHAHALPCGRCHHTSGWPPLPFAHQRVVEEPCATCHGAVRPDDALHAGGADCRACHGTAAWRPASFDHAKHFPLTGAHQLPCLDCHRERGRFDTYVCTDCHEHSPARLAREHDEEGLTDLRDCVRCHRGGGHGSGRDDD